MHVQATREAVKVMLAAVAATGEAALKVDATLAELQQLQVLLSPSPALLPLCRVSHTKIRPVQLCTSAGPGLLAVVCVYPCAPESPAACLSGSAHAHLARGVCPGLSCG